MHCFSACSHLIKKWAFSEQGSAIISVITCVKPAKSFSSRALKQLSSLEWWGGQLSDSFSTKNHSSETLTYNFCSPWFIFIYPLSWAATWQNQQSECAPSKDSDQPGHPPSLIWVFAVCMKKARVLSYPYSAQQRLWSDWANAQADLSLLWVHTHFVSFVMSRLSCFSKVTLSSFNHSHRVLQRLERWLECKWNAKIWKWKGCYLFLQNCHSARTSWYKEFQSVIVKSTLQYWN